MTIDEQIIEALMTKSDDELRDFVNRLELWCKTVRRALNQKAEYMRRVAVSKKPDGSQLSDEAKQEILDAQTVVFLGIDGDEDTLGLLNTFPVFDVADGV